jgi:hypothetical protein
MIKLEIDNQYARARTNKCAPYSLFIPTINAEETKHNYTTRFKFLELIGTNQQMELTVQQRCEIFTDKTLAE